MHKSLEVLQGMCRMSQEVPSLCALYNTSLILMSLDVVKTICRPPLPQKCSRRLPYQGKFTALNVC